jgi:hypothetical protein
MGADHTPAAFLPPPRRERKHFTDVPLLDVPPGGTPHELVLDELVAEVLAANPDADRDVPWQRKRAKDRRR